MRLTSIEHDERGPVERVVEIRAVHEVVSGEVQGLMLGFSGNEVRVKAHHEFGSGGIIDTPESHENGLDTGFLERGLESDDAVLRYGSGGCVAVSVSMVLSRDCRRDQGYPKTVAPMSSVFLVRAKTFSAHVAFNFGHDVRGKRFNAHEELHSMERNDHQ